MAGFGHVAVGMAAARFDNPLRPRASAMALWSALSLLPDLDVIGFALGVRYGDPWGHRGATHSLAFAIAAGLVIGAAAGRLGRPARRTALVASAVLASHALLDAMTDGGLGCAFFWPFDLTRYFLPWRPIPVAPIGFGFLSAYGAMVTAAELLIFAPALIFALSARPIATRRTGFLLGLWLVSLAGLSYSDGTRDAIAGLILREDTAYTRGFSEAAFRTIGPGNSESDVRRALGPPFRELWFYGPPDPRPPDERPAVGGQCVAVSFVAGAVAAASDADVCRSRGVVRGAAPAEVSTRLGVARESCWQYTWSPGGRTYRERFVCFSNGRVTTAVRRWS